MGYVVDANVCAKWFLKEEHDEEAARVLEAGVPLWAPDLLVSEVGNIVWKKCVRGEITLRYGEDALRALSRSRLELTPAPELSDGALAIALALRHPFYDSLYLALAQRERVPLVTADRRLHDKLAGTRYVGLTLWLGDI